MTGIFIDQQAARATGIFIDQQATFAAGISAIEVASCNFSVGGHEWRDVTTHMDLETKWRCAGCDARGWGQR